MSYRLGQSCPGPGPAQGPDQTWTREKIMAKDRPGPANVGPVGTRASKILDDFLLEISVQNFFNSNNLLIFKFRNFEFDFRYRV